MDVMTNFRRLQPIGRAIVYHIQTRPRSEELSAALLLWHLLQVRFFFQLWRGPIVHLLVAETSGRTQVSS